MSKTSDLSGRQKILFILFILVALANFLLLSEEKEESPAYILPMASMAREAGH